jgi:hypothetical protein
VNKIQSAFEAGHHEMAVEYVWRRTMVSLKKQLSALGMNFIGEMLSRPDIDDSSPADAVITDYEAIQLAQELGIVNSTGALRLKQTSELLSHFANPDVEDELTFPEALQGLRTCVENILASERVSTALDFAKFRTRLEKVTLPSDDNVVKNLLTSPYFFQRTTVRVLLALAKTSSGAQLENALANINLLIPTIWDNLKDPDRWACGQTYSEVTAAGRSAAAAGLKKALIKVKGFDYVPENLRSESYLKAANAVLTAHDGLNNFYNEPAPTKVLASLGSTIPTPVLHTCMTALLCVRLGNSFGKSYGALDPARKGLRTISADRWVYYLSECLPIDERVIFKLTQEKPAREWISVVAEYNLANIPSQNPEVNKLIRIASEKKLILLVRTANNIYEKLGYK